jgi:hypothetical protein
MTTLRQGMSTLRQNSTDGQETVEQARKCQLLGRNDNGFARKYKLLRQGMTTLWQGKSNLRQRMATKWQGIARSSQDAMI